MNVGEQDGATALHLATARVSCGAVEALLRAGVAINARDRSGAAALHLAAARGCMDIIDRLISFGAEIDLRDLRGETPLHRAACDNRGSAAKRLLLHGANPKLRNADLQTALDLARSAGAARAVREIDHYIRSRPASYRWRMALRAMPVNLGYLAPRAFGWRWIVTKLGMSDGQIPERKS